MISERAGESFGFYVGLVGCGTCGPKKTYKYECKQQFEKKFRFFQNFEVTAGTLHICDPIHFVA